MAYDPLLPFNDLPDLPPNINYYQPEIVRALAAAARNLGELKGLCATLPDPLLLLNTLVLQESRDSSAIENIVTTQDELYRASLEETTPNSSAKEVLNYREATYVPDIDYYEASLPACTGSSGIPTGTGSAGISNW